MKKLLIVVAAIAVLSGCGAVDRAVAKVTGSAESCIDGVKYIQFASGVTVKYNGNGTIATCN